MKKYSVKITFVIIFCKLLRNIEEFLLFIYFQKKSHIHYLLVKMDYTYAYIIHKGCLGMKPKDIMSEELICNLPK